MSMYEWFLMHMTAVDAYAIGFQPIRHQVVGQSGMSKHARAWLYILFVPLVRDTLTAGAQQLVCSIFRGPF